MKSTKKVSILNNKLSYKNTNKKMYIYVLQLKKGHNIYMKTLRHLLFQLRVYRQRFLNKQSLDIFWLMIKRVYRYIQTW